jgi:DNA repair exonuclease SbcCD ATPase subunit
MDKIYCGIAEDANIPKGKKRGTMKQCADKGAIYYWGKLKSDSVQIKQAQKKELERRFKGKTPATKNYEKMYDKKISEFASLKGKINKIDREMKAKQDNKTELKDLEKEKENVENNLQKVKDEMKEIKKNIDEKKTKVVKGGSLETEIKKDELDELEELKKKYANIFESKKTKVVKGGSLKTEIKKTKAEEKIKKNIDELDEKIKNMIKKRDELILTLKKDTKKN